nr:hypothetical protein [Tanacetum cinerariifolium]
MYKEYLAEFLYSAKSLENSKVFFSTPTGGIYGEVGVNTFRNSISAHYLPHSSEYVAPSSIDIVRLWFKTIGYGEAVPAKGTLKKSLLPLSLANEINIDYAIIFWEDIIVKLNKKHREKVVPYIRFLSLLMMHKMKEGYRDDKRVVFKAPKPSSNAKRVPQGTKPGAKPGHKKHSTFLKQPFVSSKEATKGGSSKAPAGSKTGHSKKRIESNSTVDSNPSQPPVSTPVDTGMHKKDQQATGGPTSLGVTNKIKCVSDGLETVLTTPETRTRIAAKTSEKIKFGAIKLEDLAKLVPNVKDDFKELDSLEDDPIIMVNDSEEDDEEEKNEEIHSTTNDETKDILASTPPSPSSLPTELKDLSSKLNELTEEVKGLKKQVHELKLKLPGDLKDIPSKLEDFQRLDSDDQTTYVPGFTIESSKKKELKMFDFVTEDGEHVHITKEQISAQKKIEEEAKAEAARRKGKIRKEELIDLLGPKVVNKKGPITLKVYREDDTSEIIPEFKASDLHLALALQDLRRLGSIFTSVYAANLSSKEIIPQLSFNHLAISQARLIDERKLHKRDYDNRVNKRQMQTKEGKVDTSKALDASLVDTDNSLTELEKQDTSNKSRNDIDDDDADIRPIYDEKPMDEARRVIGRIKCNLIGHVYQGKPKKFEAQPVKETKSCVLSWIAICLALRFAQLKTFYCVLLRTDSAKLKSALRFVLEDYVLSSRRSCILPWKHCVLPKSRILRFVSEALHVIVCHLTTTSITTYLLKILHHFHFIILQSFIMSTPNITSSTDSQMHNNIMAAGSKDRPPMLAIGRYPQWSSRFLRYIDTRPNGKALRKCILSGPYKPTTVLVQAVEATDDSLAIPKHTTVETPMNMSPENKAHLEAEKEAIHLILTGIGDEIYSTVDACQTAQEMWEAIERLQQGESLNIQDVKTNLFWEFGKFTSHDRETMESYYTRFYKLPEWSRFVTIVKQQHKLDAVLYHKLFDILKQYQKEVNELRAERLARNANPLALVATAQANQDPYYQTSRSHKSHAPSPKPSIPTRSHTTTRQKGKEIAKPINPLSETASEEDSNPKQAQRDKDMQKNLALIAKYLKKIYKPTNNNIRTSSNSRNKNVDTTLRYKNDDHSRQFRNQRTVNVAGAREKVGSPVVQQSGIQCFNSKGFRHFTKECRKPKKIKDFAYHKEKMLLCKQAEKGVPLQA